MRNIIVLLFALGGAIAIYNFSKESTDHITNYNIAVDYLKKNDFNGAIPYLEKAIASKPSEERILMALEEAYLQTGQTEKAEDVQRKLAK